MDTSTLNTTFKQKSNATFNNILLPSPRIAFMHPQMKRLYEAAEAMKGITGQSALARALNMSPQVVKNWETRGVSKQGMMEAEAIIGCSWNWIKTGQGSMVAQRSLARENTEPGPDIAGKVPLISWVQAGEFTEAVDVLHPGDAYEWIETTVPVRAHTFAVRVNNDSMEPDFPAGTILIVEPELEAHAGDFVIAKNGDEEATFKQLVRDGADWYLKPLNPRYPLKPLSGCQVVGVVRASERRFR